MATDTATPVLLVSRAAASSWTSDLACALAAVWLAGGLYLDGWAHTHRAELETFFTPWHAVMYSGFAALATCLALPVLRRRRAGMTPRGSVPAGYGIGLIGVAIFLVGGVADMAWHTFLGVEVDLEALLSPPHLTLLTGGMLMILTPLRAAVARTGGLPANLRGALPTIIALSVAAAVAAFFLSYLSPFAKYPLVSTSEPGWQGTGVATFLITTVVLVVPVIGAHTLGGRIPVGLITAITAAAAIPAGVFVDFRWLPVQIGALVGGVIADAVAQTLTGQVGRFAPVVTGAVIPLLVWPGYLIGLTLRAGVAWSLELWSGTVVLSALAGAALGWLTGAPPARKGFNTHV
jgi:hypothetical protein